LGISVILFSARRFRQNLKTFYMLPCALTDATTVRIMVGVADEAGNLVQTDEVRKVQTNEAGDRLVSLNLLNYIFCPETAAFTAQPKGHGGVPECEAELTRIREAYAGDWALRAAEGPGLSPAAAKGALQGGVQGRNEIEIEIPTILEGCQNEFYTIFYIYQFAAVLLAFFWDYVTVGLMQWSNGTIFYIYQIAAVILAFFWDYVTVGLMQFAAVLLAFLWEYVTVGLMQCALVLACGVIKVWTERQQRLELHAISMINELVWTKRSDKWRRLVCAELCVGDVVCLGNDGGDGKDEEEGCVGDVVCLVNDGGDGKDEEEEGGGGGVMIAADAILVAGACVVDESMLTGETAKRRVFVCGKEEEEDEGSSWVMIAADAILVAGACVVDESMLTGETDEAERGSSGVMIAADAILVAGACVVDQCMLTGETTKSRVLVCPVIEGDAILIAGACVVDESMLTGETMPMQKFPVEPDARPRHPDSSDGKKVFLFSGTHLLHATGAPTHMMPDDVEEGVVAVVTHVGARSTRGALFRTLLFGSPLEFQAILPR
ncbi:hypothetical protein T484DRAFT_1801033, partial [Baffinella frigidus]